ncbi:MAG: TCR/Tet family MFS transporter [Verrucomicrobiales bacterium]
MTRPRPALIFIFITLFLDVLGLGLIIPILPRLIDELTAGGIDNASYMFGALAGIYSLMQFVCAPVIGSLSDRFGRRPVILVSLFGSGIDYFLMGWAPTLAWFFIARIISGITGANFTAAVAYIADISPKEKRAANFGIIGAAFGLGFIFGPALGGWLGEENLRLPFYVAGVLTLINWLYGVFILPESLKPENRRAFRWERSNPVGALLELRRHPLVHGLSISYFLSSLAHQIYPAIWVLYTAFRYNWTTKETGLSLALVGLTGAIVQGGLSRIIIPKIGERNAAVGGLLIMAASMVGYGLSSEPWIVYPIIVFGSFGGLAVPAMQGMISITVGADEQGGIQGSLTSLQSVAGFMGPPLATGVFGYFISKHAPFILPGASFFCSALIVGLAAIIAAKSFKAGQVNYRGLRADQETDS